MKIKRGSISREKRSEYSHMIWEKLKAHPFFIESSYILTFVSTGTEVDTHSLIKDCLTGYREKHILVPRVSGTEMDFYEIKDMAQLKQGYYGILEPDADAPLISPAAGLILMPGLAFDEKGGRVGYGGGFYDKYLHKHPELKKIALAFDIQMMPSIDTDTHDIKPDIIITEKHIINCQEER
jgi:5-formyltetrahydrofolate cyclo-ligase